jgi:hypothetical protein
VNVDVIHVLDQRSLQASDLTTANTVFADLNGRSGYPLKYGIMEDKGR